MSLESRLSRGVLEALEDPALPLELLAVPPWWPKAAAVCALQVMRAIRGSLPDFPPGSPEALVVAFGIVNQVFLDNPTRGYLVLARGYLTHARELVALGPRDCDLALRALAILDRLVP